MSISINLGGFGSFTSHTGSSPEPFDAINGHRLAGPQGSHPLHSVAAEELLRPHDDAVTGEIVLDRPAMVGEGITGTLRVTAVERIDARKAALRLVGLRLDEVRRSTEDRDSDGHVTRLTTGRDRRRPFIPRFPSRPSASSPAGRDARGTFRGAGARSADGALAKHRRLSADRWDIAMIRPLWPPTAPGPAPRPARARRREQATSPLAGVPVGDAMIGVTTPLPAPAGSEMAVSVRWPSAPGGSKGRVELHRRTNAPNGTEGIVASVPIDPGSLAGGTEVRLAVPAGAAPSFDGAGLEINYVIRVLVDRRLRSDAAIEPSVAIV
jgi:hypothetical protein